MLVMDSKSSLYLTSCVNIALVCFLRSSSGCHLSSFNTSLSLHNWLNLILFLLYLQQSVLGWRNVSMRAEDWSTGFEWPSITSPVGCPFLRGSTLRFVESRSRASALCCKSARHTWFWAKRTRGRSRCSWITTPSQWTGRTAGRKWRSYTRRSISARNGSMSFGMVERKVSSRERPAGRCINTWVAGGSQVFREIVFEAFKINFSNSQSPVVVIVVNQSAIIVDQFLQHWRFNRNASCIIVVIGHLHDDVRWRWVTTTIPECLASILALIDREHWQSILVVVVT